MTTFDELGLSPKALKAVRQLGYKEPTPVQEQSIPLLLEGKDVIAGAQTGTGKTAAFALPCLDKLDRAGRGAGPIMLVITPTRELASQIGEVCETVAKFTNHSVLTVVGGVSYKPQIEGLRKGCDVLIATPGRLEDLISQDAADLSLVTTLIIDEADRMLDMGFLPSVERIVKLTHPDRQTMLFSATVDKEVMSVSKRMLRNPEKVEIARKGDTAETVDQYIIRISHAAKSSLLAAVLNKYGGDRVIVFARTRHRADACARRVKKAGFKADVIHSDRSQNQRKRALDAFADGKVGVLVATDVLARGIDVDEVSYVVNYDMPTQPEDYVHRIGRTGRAGHRGMAISFVSPETESELRDIEKLTKQKIEEITIDGFDREAAEAEAEDRVIQSRIRREKDPEIAKVLRENAEADKAKRKSAKTKADLKEKASEQPKQKNKGGNKPKRKNKDNAKPKAKSKASLALRAQEDVSVDAKASSKRRGKIEAKSSADRKRKDDRFDKKSSHSGRNRSKASTRGKSNQSTPKKDQHVSSKKSKREFGESLMGKDFAPGRAHRAEMRRARSKKR